MKEGYWSKWEVTQIVKKGRGEGSVRRVEVAEWSKAVDSGSIPKGRGFKSHLQHFLSLVH